MFINLRNTDNFRNSIWNDLDKIHEELYNSFLGNANLNSYAYPPVNVYSNPEDVLVTALIPGIDPNSIDINVIENKVTLKANKKAEDIIEGIEVHRQEILQRDFLRTIELPFQVDTEKVDANCKNGVLYIRLPKIEAERPKKISIKIEN